MRSIKCKLQFILVILCTITSFGVMSDTYYHQGTTASTMKINDTVYSTFFNHSKINRKTKWWKGRGKPPIDKAKAYKLAHAKLISQFPSFDWKEKKTTLDFTSAKKGYYAVKFVDSSNKSENVTLYVLMTGEVSKIKKSESSVNKEHIGTKIHIGTSYSSSKEAAEIAYKKAVGEAKMACRSKGGLLNLKPGSLNMPLVKKDNLSAYKVKLSVRYACRK